MSIYIYIYIYIFYYFKVSLFTKYKAKLYTNLSGNRATAKVLVMFS